VANLFLKVVDRGGVTGAGAPAVDVYLQRQHDTSRETLLYRLGVPRARAAEYGAMLGVRVEESRQVAPITEG
jgi:hypothetical protein